MLSGAVAQLVARLVRNEKVRGSNPLSSTTVSFLQSCCVRLFSLNRLHFISAVVNAIAAIGVPLTAALIRGPRAKKEVESERSAPS